MFGQGLSCKPKSVIHVDICLTGSAPLVMEDEGCLPFVVGLVGCHKKTMK